MKILEAGCGREWELDLAPADFELTGVDLDAHALEHRRSVTRDLDIGIVGTICDRDIVPSNTTTSSIRHTFWSTSTVHSRRSRTSQGGSVPAGSSSCFCPTGTPCMAGSLAGLPTGFMCGSIDISSETAMQANQGSAHTRRTMTRRSLPMPSLLSAESATFSVLEFFAVNTFLGSPGPKSAAVRLGIQIISRLSRGRLSPKRPILASLCAHQ